MESVRGISNAWVPNFIGKLQEKRSAGRGRDIRSCNIKIYLKRTIHANSDWIHVDQGRVQCCVLLNTVIRPLIYQDFAPRN
jgi:hypothetical protein